MYPFSNKILLYNIFSPSILYTKVINDINEIIETYIIGAKYLLIGPGLNKVTITNVATAEKEELNVIKSIKLFLYFTIYKIPDIKNNNADIKIKYILPIFGNILNNNV